MARHIFHVPVQPRFVRYAEDVRSLVGTCWMWADAANLPQFVEVLDVTRRGRSAEVLGVFRHTNRIPIRTMRVPVGALIGEVSAFRFIAEARDLKHIVPRAYVFFDSPQRAHQTPWRIEGLSPRGVNMVPKYLPDDEDPIPRSFRPAWVLAPRLRLLTVEERERFSGMFQEVGESVLRVRQSAPQDPPPRRETPPEAPSGPGLDAFERLQIEDSLVGP